MFSIRGSQLAPPGRLGIAPSADLNANLLAAQQTLDETRRIGTSRKRVGDDRLTPRG